MAQLTKEHLQALIGAKIRDIGRIENENAASRRSGSMPTFVISYVGREFPEESLNGFLESIDPYPAVPDAPNLYVLAVAKTGYINIDFYINNISQEIALAVAAEFSKRRIGVEYTGTADARIIISNDFRKNKGYE